MTEPPKNDTVSACAAPLVWAAVAVRTLALVAVRMPKYPARPDAIAPTAKARAACQPRPIHSSTMRTTPTIARSWSSRRMNVIAPM